jgi:hypothetical protein
MKNYYMNTYTGYNLIGSPLAGYMAAEKLREKLTAIKAQ